MRVRPAAGEDDTGAVAVLVALFIAFVAFGIGALVLDLGSLWTTQRALVLDTDAAALAGTITLAEAWMDTGDCEVETAESDAEAILLTNNPDDFDIDAEADCQVNGNRFTGTVRMTASQPSDQYFSGNDDLSVRGTSTATFVLKLGLAEGFAVCSGVFGASGQINKDFEIGTTTEGSIVAIPYKDSKDTLVGQDAFGACTVTAPPSGNPVLPGGWGWIGLHNNPEPCDLDDDRDSPIWCEGSTGNNHLGQQLTGKVGEEFRFPIFDAAGGSGSNGIFRIVGRADVRLLGHCDAGPSSSAFLPEDCTNIETNFNGQPAFVVVEVLDVHYFFDGNSTARMFTEAEYSVCDVDGSGRFCPS